MYTEIKRRFMKIIEENGLLDEAVNVKAKPLTAEEAIGNPERDDFPLIKGRERLMQAEFRGSYGQAFSDMYGNFEGSISDILNMDLNNNYRRAVFIATINAVMRHLKMVDKTVHCKDKDPEECGKHLIEFISENYGKPKIAFIGLQPALMEHCSRRFEVRCVDLDKDNIGKKKFGTTILDGGKDTQSILEWCDLAMVTGTTAVNETIGNVTKMRKPTVFYGVTIAGVARLLNLNRFCPFSK